MRRAAHWVNYAPATPLHKGIRSYFADDVVSPVHIRVDMAPISRAIQPTLHPLSTETGRWLRRVGRIVDGQRIAIQKAGLAGVALLGHAHVNAHKCRLVGQ